MTDDAVVYMGWSLSAQEQIDGFRKEVRELKAENANLRELVTDLWEYIHIGTSQDGQSLHDHTRELGIEVDE